MADEAPAAARAAREDDLLERVHELRTELVRRGEYLDRGWVEQATRDLRSGELTGWWYPASDRGAAGLAFYTIRGERAYGHVHVEPGAAALDRAERLGVALLRSFPPEVRRADVGLSGLEPPEEEGLGERLVRDQGGSVLRRRSLERAVTASDATEPALPTGGLRTAQVRSVPIEGIAALDLRAFRGTPDEQLLAESLEEDLRGLTELLDGRLGRFLDEASEALRDEADDVVGAVLVAEQTARRAIVLDLVVDPRLQRHGIALYLMRRVFRALRALGFESARLWVTESNRPAQALYDRLGFHWVSSARIYRWTSGPADAIHSKEASPAR